MVSRKIFPEAAAQQAPGQSIPFPAPVKGLNTRDSVLTLGQDEARVLVNWLPDAGRCTVRPGYSTFGSAIAGSKAVKTLVRYANGTTTKLLGASNGSLFEVSSGTPSSLASGYSSDYWSVDYMNGYTFGVNGTDTPWRYDGTTVSATGFTGPSLTALRTVKNVYNRLWFTNGTGDVYYGPLEGVTGPLTLFQLSQIADGGKCIAVMPWRLFTCFFYDTGQVLVYQGDPASGAGTGSDFTEISKYYAPPLIEPDACMKMGGELIAMTQSGPISLDVIAAGNAFKLDQLGNWSKINPSWQNDWKTYGSNAGWFGKFINGLAYFNVATGTSTTKQYVFNTRNQAWTTYLNLPLSSMEYFNGNIYLGSSGTDGKILLHSGGLDGTSSIITIARPGYGYIGDANRKKAFTQIKPNITTGYLFQAQMQIDVDFMTSDFTAFLATISAGGSTTPWDSSWDTAWAETSTNYPVWFGVNATGRAASAVMQAYSQGADVQWFDTDVWTIPADGGTT